MTTVLVLILVLLLIVVAFVVAAVVVYNRLATSRNAVDNSWARSTSSCAAATS